MYWKVNFAEKSKSLRPYIKVLGTGKWLSHSTRNGTGTRAGIKWKVYGNSGGGGGGGLSAPPPPPPHGPNCFQFHAVFSENLIKIICLRPCWRVGAPSYGNPGSAPGKCSHWSEIGTGTSTYCYRPRSEASDGYVFTGMCHSLYPPGRPPPPPPPPLPPDAENQGIRSMHRRYVSYWNAFLFPVVVPRSL